MIYKMERDQMYMGEWNQILFENCIIKEVFTCDGETVWETNLTKDQIDAMKGGYPLIDIALGNKSLRVEAYQYLTKLYTTYICKNPVDDVNTYIFKYERINYLEDEI